MIRWSDEMMIQWDDDTMRWWYNEMMIQWDDDTMRRWYDEMMIRWHDHAYEMMTIRWDDDTMRWGWREKRCGTDQVGSSGERHCKQGDRVDHVQTIARLKHLTDRQALKHPTHMIVVFILLQRQLSDRTPQIYISCMQRRKQKRKFTKRKFKKK